MLVGARGFEPPTTSPPAKCATRLRYAPKARIVAEIEPPKKIVQPAEAEIYLFLVLIYRAIVRGQAA